MSAGSNRWTDVGLLWLRFLMGVGIAHHGYGKVFGGQVTQLAAGLVKLGFPMPEVFAWAAALSEFLGGILIVLGFQTRLAAFFVFSTMSVAWVLAHAHDPLKVKELALCYWTMAGTLILTGGGAYTLESRLTSRRNRGRWVVAQGIALAAALALIGEAEAATTKDKRGLLPLGAEAPAFRLPDVVSGKVVSRDDFADRRALLVMFICRHCPYVQHVNQGIARLARDYAGQDLAIVAISANDPAGFRQDAPESLKEMALAEGFGFPLLFDETQEVAQAYTAVCTPDFLLFDNHRRLVYRGQFDASRPGNFKPVTGQDVRAAIDALLEGRPIPTEHTPAFGCSIKWKPGNEPAYAR